MAHNVISGLAAATAAVLAKLSLTTSDSPLHTSLSARCVSTLSSLSLSPSSTTTSICSHGVRGLAALSLVILNCANVSSFVKGIKDKGSVAGTATSFAVNFCASALYGMLLFNEVPTPLWSVGFVLILLGVALLSRVELVAKTLDDPSGKKLV